MTLADANATDACGHDGWRAGCPHCEAQEREAMQLLGVDQTFTNAVCQCCGEPATHWDGPAATPFCDDCDGITCGPFGEDD